MTARATENSGPTALMNEAAMCAFAARVAGMVKPPMVIYLHGDLGAGKTTFVRAFVHGLGYTGSVKSPTYGLLEKYALQGFQLVHLDLYRIVGSGELEFLGISDEQDSKTVFMIEWPERGGSQLPGPDLSIHFEHRENQRFLALKAHNTRARELCQALGKVIDNSSS